MAMFTTIKSRKPDLQHAVERKGYGLRDNIRIIHVISGTKYLAQLSEHVPVTPLNCCEQLEV